MLAKITVVAPLQLSEAGMSFGFGAGTLSAQATAILGRQLIVGGTTSFTVMICVQELALPQGSIA